MVRREIPNVEPDGRKDGEAGEARTERETNAGRNARSGE